MSRKRLYLYSVPVCVVVLLLSLKMISVVVLGDSARSNFGSHDIDALDSDVSWLQMVDIIEPGTTAYAAGAADALAGRLPDAERHFAEALRRADSCPVRVNLVLVRETLGDLGFRDGNRDGAIRGYREALAVAQSAPVNCFDGNDDPDEQRRVVRADAISRLQHKLAFVTGSAVAPPPPPPVAPPPPPPAAGAAVPEPEQPSEAPKPRLLGPGDPQDLLRRLLDDANSTGSNRE
ncbi:hypothetical protein BVC93_00175 [Mycobacterium sp. MS1601]|uniref:tetratricopeptide repeat protein n=1 Tax=Mycobacterium sp. MS1601 TaxID=1936029 RepID=UPI0009795570|nr:tetratricopeptide repeat protein [Mycobacterium sp. MS1601]AQA01090.1 hypothetical protein BVC93_00175 [Mycobacterium sp. MS1601]